jgi:hypothetical protein
MLGAKRPKAGGSQPSALVSLVYTIHQAHAARLSLTVVRQAVDAMNDERVEWICARPPTRKGFGDPGF